MHVCRKGGKFQLVTKRDGSERLRAKALGARFNKIDRTWDLKVSVLSALKIVESASPFDNIDEAKKVLSYWEQAPPLVVPSTKVPLMPHQVRSASRTIFFKRNNDYSDMGTGKTGGVIGAAQYLWKEKSVRTVLVVVPMSVFASWTRAVKKFCAVPNRVVTLSGDRKGRTAEMDRVKTLRTALKGKYLVFALVNYEALRIFKDDLMKMGAEMVVFDECNYVKNRKAKMSEAACDVSRDCAYSVALTGTPISVNVGDLYSQLHVVSSDFVGDSYWGFVDEFARFGGFKGKKIVGTRNLDELERLLKLISVRVRKDEVLDLPDRTYDTREIVLEGDQKRAYEKAEGEFYFSVDAVKKHTGERKEMTVLVRNALSRLLRCQQIAAGHCKGEDGSLMVWPDNPKQDELVRTVKEAGRQKVVVFSRFVEDLEAGDKALTKAGFECATYHGKVKQEDRGLIEQRILDPKGDLQVVLAQVRTGGFGVDFSSASIAFFYTNWFSWAVRDQAESRLHRLGQKRNVHVLDCIAQGSVDETVLEAVLERKSLSEILFGRKFVDIDNG